MGIIGHCYAIRELFDKQEAYLSSITARECVRDTYIYMIYRNGWNKYFRFRVIIWLLRKYG